MDIDDPVEVVPNDPLVTHPREVREALIEVKNSNELYGHSSNAPASEYVPQTAQAHGPNSHETVIINEVDEDSSVQPMQQNDNSNDQHLTPSAPAFDNLPDYGNDIEEQMIQAAIEASKRDVEESSDPGPWHNMSHSEDAVLEEAVSMSLKTAEQKKVLREQGSCAGVSEVEASKPAEQHLVNMAASNGRLIEGSSSIQDEAEDKNEQLLVRHRSRQISSGSGESANEIGVEASPPSSPGQQGIGSLPLNIGNAFPSDEWGGISSVEHDEAIMLEAAMFGGIPENGYRFPYAPHQFIRPEGPNPWHTPRSPSPSLAAQRLIREQQDDEYNAALQSDREKELKAIQEAEACHLEEEAARKAVLEEDQRKQECERQLAAKEASLPQEPSSNEENAVNLLVRMPDGIRRGRLFLKSDRLQSLYDFIDIGRGVEPGTYRLVRPYPRRAFGEEESSLTLSELGLTNKQEALFLELI
ncbi:plant UBX domain-containing protein 8-like isoform X2 [Hibiscus syriacus]|nr:plant UBX domain-containing protein 8-like isoform X2 [Hibiscus syriacus]